MNALRETLMGDITIPVFDAVVGKDGGGGANARYHIAHFAGFHVTAFKIYTDTRHQGVSTIWNDPSCLRLGGGGMQTVCLDGYFTAHQIPISEAGGEVTVKLIE